MWHAGRPVGIGVRRSVPLRCDVEPDSPPAALKPVLDMAQAGVYPDLWLEPWLNHKDVARSAYGLGGMCYSNPANLTDVALELVWGMSDRIFSTHSPDYLAGLLLRFTGIRRIPEAKLFFPEEYPDIIAAEARSLWGCA